MWEARKAFEGEVTTLSGTVNPPTLSWGMGRWRDLMSAKMLFHDMVSRWFRVPDDATTDKKAKLTGRQAEKAVAVDVLKNHKDSMPADFSKLRHILDLQLT